MKENKGETTDNLWDQSFSNVATFGLNEEN